MIETVGLSSLILMENAAKIVVDAIIKQFPLQDDIKQSIVVLCGTGNNGGDGLCIARWLIHKGYEVHAILLGTKERCTSENLCQMAILESLIQADRISTFEILETMSRDELTYENEIHHRIKGMLKNATLIVDSILGTGCHRTLSPFLVAMVELVNGLNKKVLAVDIPTGIDADNGKVMGIAIKAYMTVTFSLPKIGHFCYPGFDYCGTVIVGDIGIFENALHLLENPIMLIDKNLFLTFQHEGVFRREKFSHKGMFGTLGIIAGDSHMIGATLLAVKAAYKSGVGLVKVFAKEEHAYLFLSSVNECVVVSYPSECEDEELDERIKGFLEQVDAVLIGPGLSRSIHAKHLLQQVLQGSVRAILDADALNIVSENLDLLSERKCELIITPHIGEMSRLTGYCSSGIIENMMPFAEAFSDQHKLTTVLKSGRTVIVSKALKRYINILGNSGMATAGSGDVLAGVISGLAAQGHSDELSAVIGTMLHSLAGDAYANEYGEHSLMATDLIHHIWKVN